MEARKRATAKTREGIVVSNSMDKTVVVAVKRTVRHSRYRKYLQTSTKYLAHDERNDADEHQFAERNTQHAQKLPRGVLHRQDLAVRPPVKPGRWRGLGRGLERNILEYLSTGTAAQTEQAAGIGGRGCSRHWA